MRGTALVYSSHNRSNYIHDRFIAQRALHGWADRRVLFLPMSETPQNGSELERQEYHWSTFDWFLRFYERFGLEAFPFYFRSDMRKEDVDKLWHYLWNSEVVILGGGHSLTGMQRYKQLGARFDGEWGKFGRILHERQRRGLLTVGFSAGADQLCEYLFRRVHGDTSHETDAFGLVRNTMVTLHHEPSRNGDLAYAAQRFPQCMVFGLPNDSGLYVDQGVLPSGNWWQVIEFVIDKSWDEPRDFWHIKTRSGALIEHFSCDGWHWAFRGGDRLVRIQSPDNRFHEAWMMTNGQFLHYWSRQPRRFGSIEHVLSAH
jgi:hypothetical protein